MLITLSAKIRSLLGRKVRTLRKKGVLPGVVYGPKLKNISIELNLKEFKKVYREAGESSLITLAIAEGEDEALASSPSDEIGRPKRKKFLVLIREVKIEPLTEKPIHVDFYQPSLEKEIEATIPLIFEGVSPAVKELKGTLIKNISELEVKALPQSLPREIKVNVEGLKTLEDDILIKDLKLPEGVKILKDPQEVVVSVVPLEKVEEELEKPIEEKVEEVEKVEEKKEEEKEEKEEKEE